MASPIVAKPMQFLDIPEFYLIVTQNNAQKICVIEEVSNSFAELLGKKTDNLIGEDLQLLLAGAGKAFLEEQLEYEDDGVDLYDIISKLRQLKWKGESGEELALPIQVERIAAESLPRFRLLVPNERAARAKTQLHEFLKSHLEGQAVIDDETGLINRESCLSFFQSISHFSKAQNIPVAFATMRMDRHDKSVARYGYKNSLTLIKHMAQGAKRALAGEDVVARLSDKQLALFMFDVSRESARVILNRLRWLIRSHRIDFGGKRDFSVTVSFAFDMLGNDMPYNVAEMCEQALLDLPDDERNRLIEFGA